MGTSQSSKGPGAKVPMVPPWVEPVPSSEFESEPAPLAPESPLASPAESNPQPAPDDTIPIAPDGRFGNARRSLGSFAATGNTQTMRRAVARYIRDGYGGASTFGRRMAGTSRTAGQLAGILASGTLPGGATFQQVLDGANGDANRLMDSIAAAVKPTDGTQDAESARLSIRQALGALLERYPDADLTSLTSDQQDYATERFVALDVYNRFVLDMQESIKAKAGDPSTALLRLKQIRDYISETVAASFRGLRSDAAQSARSATQLAKAALLNALNVFEAWL